MPARTANKDINRLNQESAQADELLAGPRAADDSARRSTRIVAIPLSQVLPDRYQSRVILPPEIKEPFYNGEIDCYDAARQMLNASHGDDGLRREVDELLLLGTSILKDSQIEPATGSWIKTAAGSRFLLEAGERRFWSLALIAVEQQMGEEPRLKIVEQKEVGRVRQISENLQREDLCAVDLAKAIASLILELQGIQPVPDQNELAYYRQAINARVPQGTWPEIKRIVKMDRTYLFRHLQLLKLDDELLYLASIYRLEEYRLRTIVAAPAEMQRTLIVMAIKEKLTQADLVRAAEEGKDAGGEQGSVSSPGPHRKLAGRVKSVLQFISRSDFDRDFDEVAAELSTLLRNPAEDLGQAADYFEALANSLRKAQKRVG